jgi:hypothetical protein
MRVEPHVHLYHWPFHPSHKSSSISSVRSSHLSLPSVSYRRHRDHPLRRSPPLQLQSRTTSPTHRPSTQRRSTQPPPRHHPIHHVVRHLTLYLNLHLRIHAHRLLNTPLQPTKPPLPRPHHNNLLQPRTFIQPMQFPFIFPETPQLVHLYLQCAYAVGDGGGYGHDEVVDVAEVDFEGIQSIWQVLGFGMELPGDGC